MAGVDTANNAQLFTRRSDDHAIGPNGTLIGLHFVPPERCVGPTLASRGTVVGGNDHKSVLPESLLLKGLDYCGDPVVNGGQHSGVRFACVIPAWLGFIERQVLRWHL